MTVLFTSGYPFSGKTEFVKELTNQLSGRKVIHIDPTSLRPIEYSTLDAGAQTKARIAAWEVAQEMLISSMKEPSSTVVIFDTCAAKSKNMLPHFANAKVNKHDIVFVFVGAAIFECKRRAGQKWPSNDIINGYATDFNESVYKLKEASSKFFFIKNNDDPNRVNLKFAAQRIAKVILDGTFSGIFKSKPIRSTVSGSGQKNNKRTKI
jgi:tRNA uridine 5-carbamoylmethylation protein Kti12